LARHTTTIFPAAFTATFWLKASSPTFEIGTPEDQLVAANAGGTVATEAEKNDATNTKNKLPAKIRFMIPTASLIESSNTILVAYPASGGKFP